MKNYDIFHYAGCRVLSELNDDNDIMVIMESDQTSEINSVEELISEIMEKGNDVVMASRYQKDGEYRNFPLLRRVFSYCVNFFCARCFLSTMIMFLTRLFFYAHIV